MATLLSRQGLRVVGERGNAPRGAGSGRSAGNQQLQSAREAIDLVLQRLAAVGGRERVSRKEHAWNSLSKRVAHFFWRWIRSIKVERRVWLRWRGSVFVRSTLQQLPILRRDRCVLSECRDECSRPGQGCWPHLQRYKKQGGGGGRHRDGSIGYVGKNTVLQEGQN